MTALPQPSFAASAALLTGRTLRHFVRQPQLLLFSTVQPVMFVLLFAFVFDGTVGDALPPGVDYIDFLLPGIFVQATAFRATQTTVGLANDLEKGVIDRLRSMPLATPAVLVGRTTADALRSVFVIVLMVAAAWPLGFRFTAGLGPALGSVAVVAVFGLALSWIFALVALTVRGAEAASSASFLVVFPLVFASSVFVPVETLPSWLQAVAAVSPITVTVDAARALALGGPVAGAVTGSLLWSAAIIALCAPLAVWRFARMS
ncbi:MAG TPA: ABC transporter permease [Egibacteraceae bacterium]